VGGLDPTKIFLILVIALIVVGPQRLPSVARQLGGAWRELNRLRDKFEEEVRAAVPDLDLPNIPTSPSKAITSYLTGLVSGQGDASSVSAVADEANRPPSRLWRADHGLWTRAPEWLGLPERPSRDELAALAGNSGPDLGA